MYGINVFDSMTKITFEIKDELDEKFRRAVANRKGIRKGVIGEALEEAIEAWVNNQAKKKVESKDE